MDNLLPVINKLQDIFNTVGSDSLKLPQIVALGSQSSGKSSVVEGIIGRDFLPRGSGMITRRPLILQLVCNKTKTWELTEESVDRSPEDLVGKIFGKFLHQPNKIYDNFQEIHDEIVNDTNRILPDKSDVSSDPIRLKIFSPDVVNLTLVDLPGLTRISIGEQPADIGKKISEMALSYISNKNSIILSVIPANVDIATSEALRVASLVDPKGDRTIICFTKLDLMDKGTNAYDILSGKVINVKFGIVGVVNRSQMDIENKKLIDAALDDEETFFKQHYPLISQWTGTKFLVKSLNKILLSHIHQCLPELRERVQVLLNKFTSISNSLGSPILDKKFALLNFITKFANIYNDIVSGSFPHMTTKELCGGSRIYYIFHETFGKKIGAIDPLEGISNNDILTTIRNAKGMRTSLFVPEIAFELLVKKQIQKLESPSIECVSMVFEEMLNIITQSGDQMPEFIRFPLLRDKVSETVKHVLNEEKQPTCLLIKNLIHSELAYINTNHPGFINTALSVSDQLNNIDSGVLPFVQNAKTVTSSKENTKNIIIREDSNEKRIESHSKLLTILIKSYLNIVHHKFQDSVPKYISCFLVNKVTSRLSAELVSRLVKDHLVDEILTESREIISQRENTDKMIEILSKANSLISEVKETILN